MANKTITDLNQFIGITANGELAVYDPAAATTKKISLGDLLSWLGANGLLPADAEPPVDNSVWGVLSMQDTSPPPSPAEGDNYLVASGASGDWAGHDGEVASYQGGQWKFSQLKTGDILWLTPADQMFVNDDGGLLEITNQPLNVSDLDNVPLVGINANASTDERFRVSSKQVVFTNEVGNDINVVFDRDSTANTAWVVMSDNMVMKWKIGQDANNAMVFMVSADGVTFNETLKISQDGQFTFPSKAVMNTSNGMDVNMTAGGLITSVKTGTNNIAGFAGGEASDPDNSGFSISYDGTYQLKFDLRNAGGVLNRVLYITPDGAWHSDDITWDTNLISVAPVSGGSVLELARPSQSEQAEYRAYTQGGGGVSIGLDASDNMKWGWTTSSTDVTFMTINRADGSFAPASGEFVVIGDIKATSPTSTKVQLVEDTNQVAFTIDVGTTHTLFAYGNVVSPSTLWKVDHLNGTISADQITFAGDTGTAVAVVISGDGSSLSLDGKYTYSVPGGDLVLTSSVDGELVRYAGGVWKYPTLSVEIGASGSGTMAVNGGASYTGDLAAGNITVNGTVSCESLRASRPDQSTDAGVTIETTGSSPVRYDIFSPSGTNYLATKVDGNNVWWYNPSNDTITVEKKTVLAGGGENQHTPYLVARDNNITAYGANTSELVKFTSTVSNDLVSVGALGDTIVFDADGKYSIDVWLKFESVDTNNPAEWVVRVEKVGSSDVFNEQEFAAFTPVASSSAGTVTKVMVSCVAVMAAGEAVRVKVDNINGQANLVLSRIEVLRGL